MKVCCLDGDSPLACRVVMNFSCLVNAGVINCVDTRNIHSAFWRMRGREVKGNVYIHSTNKWCILKLKNTFWTTNDEIQVLHFLLKWLACSAVRIMHPCSCSIEQQASLSTQNHHLLTSNIDLSLPFRFSFWSFPSKHSSEIFPNPHGNHWSCWLFCENSSKQIFQFFTRSTSSLRHI